MGVTHNTTHFIILAALVLAATPISYPIARQPDTSYQTGTQVILSTNFASTTEQAFTIPYFNVMTTASLNATLGIYGIRYYTVGTDFGWKMYVASLTSSTVIVHLAVFSSSSPIYYLKLCYLISAKPELDIAYVEYTFDPASDEVANYNLRGWSNGGNSWCSSINCRKYNTTQSYANKASPAVATFLSGFQVGSFGSGGGDDYFGIQVSASSPGTTSFTFGMTVYGKAEVSSVSYYYLAYNKAALNVDYLSEATLGRGNLGCYYPDNDCGNSGATSTTTFRTAATSVLDYNVNMFYMGIDSMIIKYDGSTNFKGEFNIIGMTQNSDSTIKVDFAFTGNTVSSGPAFSVGYSYFTFQTFYCSGPVDLYFVYQSNRCNSSCAISQYYLGRICQPCDATCYQCTGAPNTCGGCYNSQNRILVGTDCRCDTAAGFYDDGTSNVCPRCHYSCLTCSGPGSSSCLTCDMVTPANRYFNVNTCPCLTGFYDANSQVCMPCHYSCQTATCNGGSSTSCASCNTAKNRAALHSSFVCPCAPGYYDIGVETCTLCHYSCLTCSGTNTNCLTCDATKFRSYSSGSKTCPCNTRYYDALVPLCAACDSTCWTCSGALAINCLSCDPAAQRTKVGNSCPCAVYYYDLNRVCTACFYTCLTCVNSTSIGCSTCNSTAKRVYNATSGECYCSAGYVDTGSQICPACYTGCLTCSGTANTCVTCHNNPGRYLAGASCLCQSNYVDFLSNGVCTLCHYSCLTCTSGTALGCSTCPTGRIQSGSSCVCPAGKYDDGVNVVCQTCQPLCLNCTTGLSSGCTACDPLYFRTLNPSPTGSCVCQGGYYELGVLLCAPCDPKCSTCALNSTNCTSCDLATNHRVITGSFTCVCAIGYFQTGAPVCQTCTYPCYQCSNVSSNCNACYSDRYLSNNNTCQCNPGTFQNLANTACPACAPSCLTCATVLTNCLTCPANANRYQSGNSCPCNVGFYDNSVALCPPCSYRCLECTSFAVCVSCPANSRRTLTGGGCPCDVGYYDNGNRICSQCSPYCLTCSTYSQCQSCVTADNRAYNLAGLSCPCLAGFYDNGVNTTCSACHHSCATCYGGLSTNCNTCQPLRTFTNPFRCPCNTGLFQSGGACTPCSITCRTCSTISTNCTSCPSTSYLSNFQCICLNGYFLNGLVCQLCDIRCQWCSVTAGNCLTCNPLHGTTLSGSSCVCNSNQYQNSSSLVCTACSPYCLTCTSNTNTSCLTCYANMSRSYNAVFRTCPCSAGFYDSGALVCSPCVSPCQECVGGSRLNCTVCIAGYNLVGSSCVPILNCNTFYYDGNCVNTCPNITYNSGSSCLPCIYNCLTCTSNTITSCTSCLANFYFYTGMCLGICPTNTYSNNTNRSCIACPSECLQCSMRNSIVVCLSCNTNYYLLNSRCISLTNCPTANQTYVLINNLCKPCLNGCATCTSLTVSGCLTCSQGFNFYLGMCLVHCPQGFYSINRTCVACMANCTSCSTKGCEICHPGLYLNSQFQCVQIGYFMSGGSKAKCHPNCLTCTNSSFSSCILCVKYRGDESSKAISGYCDCWKGSIDVGGGKCDSQSAKSIQKANQALVSASTSLNYLSALTGVICVNYFAPVMIASYQQLYSNFYYLNSSAVLQTDEVLNNYGDTCFNKLMEKQTNKNVKRASKAFGRRLQATTQQQESLFMRGYSWKYLVDWGLYTFICVVVAWFTVLLLALISWKVKSCVNKENIGYKILNGVSIIFKENIIIVLHFLTITDVSLYGLASFKLMPNMVTSIDPLLLTFSVIMLAYYVLYLLRLFVAAIRFVGSEQQQNQFMVLFSCFYSYKKKQALCRIYVPMMMLRSFIISIALVFLAFNPIGQIVTALLVFILFTVYSFLYCPYYFYLTAFVHIFESIFIIQLLLLTISVAQPDASRVGPSFGLIILNYMQLVSFLVLTICIVLNKIYDIKCWQLKQKRVLPFKQQTEHEEIHVPVYKGKYQVSKIETKVHDETIEDMVVDETLADEKMDNDILRALHRRVGLRGEAKNAKKNNLNESHSTFHKPTSEIPRRRRKVEIPEQQKVDVFSLQDMEQSPKKNQRNSLRLVRRRQ